MCSAFHLSSQPRDHTRNEHRVTASLRHKLISVKDTVASKMPLQVLGQGAVHGAFAGFTGFTVGLVNTHYVYLPIPVIIQDTRKVDPKVRSCTGNHKLLNEAVSAWISWLWKSA